MLNMFRRTPPAARSMIPSVPLEKRGSVVGSAHPRDPVIAEWWGGRMNTAAGIHVNPERAMRLTVCYACVGLIANTFASLPAIIYRGTRHGRERERDPNHPLGEVLSRNPNPWQTPIEFHQSLAWDLGLRGNAYAQIVGSPTRAVSRLVPLEVDRTRPFLRADGRIAYEYTVDDGPPVILLDSEVWHLRRAPFSRDRLTGLSPIELHRETIGTHLAQREYQGRFYGNNATPGGILSSDQTIDEESAAELRKRWEKAQHGENRHRVAIMGGGLKWQPAGMTNEDAEFLDSMKFGVTDIARIWGIPPHLIGDLEKSTSWGTGIAEQNVGFRQFIIQPWTTLFDQSADKFLLTERSRRTHFVEYDVDALLRADFKSRIEGRAKMIQSGLSTPNEGRVAEGLAPSDAEFADDLWMQQNMAPVSRWDDVLRNRTARPANQNQPNDDDGGDGNA